MPREPHGDDPEDESASQPPRWRRQRAHSGKPIAPLTPFQSKFLWRLKNFKPKVSPEELKQLSAEDQKWTGTLNLGGLGIDHTTIGWVIGQVSKKIDMRQVRLLMLTANPIGDKGVQLLARFGLLNHVEILNVGNCGITDLGLSAITTNQVIKDLVRLQIGSNQIGDAGAKAIAAATHWTKLKSLSLGSCGIGPDGAIALADPNAAHLAELEALDLGGNEIEDAGAHAIAAATHWTKLKSLSLGSCGIGPDGAIALADPNAAHLAELEALDLQSNEIEDAGAHAIAAATHWTKLKSLSLGICGIGPPGAIALADPKATHLTELETLDLGSNQIEDAGAEAIAEATKWTKLKSLDLRANGIGNDGAAAFTSASQLTALQSFEIGGNAITDAQLAIDLLTALSSCAPSVTIALEGNPLAWGDKPPASASLLWGKRNPQELKDALLQLKDASIPFSFVRAVMAGTSGTGKTHLSKRFANPDDPTLNKPLSESDRFTKGIDVRRAKIDPTLIKVRGLPDRLWLMVQDVGGHTEQIKCHFHLAYLAGDGLFILCVRMSEDLHRWPRYYLHLLADLGRRAYNGKKRIPKPMNELPELKADEKLKVLVVPTHADAFDQEDTRRERYGQICKLSYDDQFKKTLDIKVLNSISCLDGAKVSAVLRRVTLAIKGLPYVGALELAFVETILAAVETLLTPPPAHDANAKWKCALTHEELKKEFTSHDGYQNGNFDYMVLVLLRAGLLLTPLDEVPLQGDQIEDKVGLLLNPAFVNDFIYGKLIYGDRTNSWGFVPTNEMHDQMRPATAIEKNAIIKTLESHQVIIECKRHDGTQGYLVPDRFEMRPSGQFIPEKDSTVRLVWKADNFVPEHALFELMARHRMYLEPIDRQGADIKTYAYRNACLFMKDQAEVQVYLNVLTRKLYMCGKGDGAKALITYLFESINHDRVHGWEEVKKECRTLRSEIQTKATNAFDKLVSGASDAADPAKKEATQRSYRKAFAAILLAMNREENGELVKLKDEEIQQACPEHGNTSYISARRKDLTDSKFVEHNGTFGRAQLYSIAELGKALVECMDSDGNAKVGQMPTFDPDKDSEDETPPSPSNNTA